MSGNRRIVLPMNHPARAETDEVYDTLKVYSEDDYRALSRRDRYVWDVSWMDTALMNGGSDKWFCLMGHHAPETLEALKAIDAPNTYKRIKQVCDLFPNLPPHADEEVVDRQYREFVDRHGMGIDDYLESQIEANDAEVEMELDLHQRLIDYWRSADPNVK